MKYFKHALRLVEIGCLTLRILCPVNLQNIYSNDLSINSIHYVIINVFVYFQRSTLQSVQ